MDKNKTGWSNGAFHPLKKGNGEGARSKNASELLHQTSTRVSKSTSSLSSHFYQGRTTFGGSSSYNRCLSALHLAKNQQHTTSRILKFGGRSMVRPSPVDNGQGSKPLDTPPDLKTLKRRRLYAVNKYSQNMSPKDEMSLQPEDVHSKDSLVIKPQGQRFTFTKPISLETFKSKRNYIFSPPTPLK
ncbi:uncharacterized protein LOC119549998 [Drosophila subpulchrella]|uniref:uncharacterized protein LOC119549998 n=1 Tax=Drosophila subpulchrella TaxID=1486046 RepID=UPI0018A12FB6|nr:uncharacterized protein LOC119549998 [Drosophila subpulchrella]